MRLVKPYDMLEIMSKTLSCVEPRLIDHGKRVASLTFKILRLLGDYNDNEIRDICITALLHDIGAYRTQEIEELVNVNTGSTWNHSIYGYLFFKYFSPLKHLAPIILFHHTPYEALIELEPNVKIRQVAQILHIADRLDVLVQSGADNFTSYLEARKGKQFEPSIVDTFINMGIKAPFGVDNGYIRLMRGLSLSREQILDYLKMIVFSVDYRSRHTVNHTIGTTKASEMLARFAGLDDATVEQIRAGALMHDIGKTGIALEILENKGRLSPEQMTIMKTHINMTCSILEGHVSEKIIRIASRHHEKLNGKGYVLGLSAADLTVPERILAVADVFSALYGVRSYKKSMPVSEIKHILLGMRNDEHLDGEIVQLAVEHCDKITAEIDKVSAPLFATYDSIQNEYNSLYNRYSQA